MGYSYNKERLAKMNSLQELTEEMQRVLAQGATRERQSFLYKLDDAFRVDNQNEKKTAKLANKRIGRLIRYFKAILKKMKEITTHKDYLYKRAKARTPIDERNYFDFPTLPPEIQDDTNI